MAQVELSKIIQGKKFMWDGQIYQERSQAQSMAERYSSQGFEVRIIEHQGKYLVYTRREVS